MVKGISGVVLAAGLLVLVGCGEDRRTLTVSSEESGASWPFTVESLELMCEGPSPLALARTADGQIYALSGSARSQAKDKGWKDGRDITKPNPATPMIKMDYSDFVVRAQALCGT
ncbi:DUF2511 domain-containing protein [Pseudomonas sp. Je.1.5.c]|uniref:DUF2511 domain-containing protein n=1 Tax=Pseudomonas sp. Je.1.5.c TaxID=3142839 RepID=UPI003DA847A9